MKWIILILSCLSCSAQFPLSTGAGIEWTRNTSTFSANNPPGLVIWMNPTNGTDTTVNNAYVKFWTNSPLSALGTALVFTNNSGSNLVYRTSGGGGAGNQPFLLSPGGYYQAISPTTNWPAPYWFFYVLRATNDGAININPGMLPLSGFAINNSVNNSPLLLVTNGVYRAQDFSSHPGVSSGFNYTNGWVLVSLCFSNDAGQTVFVRTNGVQAATGATTGTTNFGSSFFLGAGSASVNNWRGMYGDILFYTNNLNAAQVNIVESWLITKYALPDLSAHPETTFVTGQTLGTLRANFTGNVGFTLQPNQDMYVTQIGRWVVSGNSHTHVMTISKFFPASVIDNSVTINTSGATAGQYKYGTLATPVLLHALTSYSIESAEVNGQDQWYDQDTVLTGTSDATIRFPSANNTQQGGPGNSFGPPSIKYFVP